MSDQMEPRAVPSEDAAPVRNREPSVLGVLNTSPVATGYPTGRPLTVWTKVLVGRSACTHVTSNAWPMSAFERSTDSNKISRPSPKVTQSGLPRQRRLTHQRQPPAVRVTAAFRQ